MGLAPLVFEIISKKRCFFNFEGKKQISPLLDPLEKILGKSSSAPPRLEKNLSDAHAGVIEAIS